MKNDGNINSTYCLFYIYLLLLAESGCASFWNYSNSAIYNWKHPPPTNSLNSELAGTRSLLIPTK